MNILNLNIDEKVILDSMMRTAILYMESMIEIDKTNIDITSDSESAKSNLQYDIKKLEEYKTLESKIHEAMWSIPNPV